MSKFRRLRQHTGTTRTVIPTPAGLNPYLETGAEKAASTVHGDNKITALDRWVHRDGTVIYVVPALSPTRPNKSRVLAWQMTVNDGSEAGQALPPRHANGGCRVMRSRCANCDPTPASAASARRLSSRKPKVVPDAAHRGMWRVRWPDGRLSDMTNLTRAKDAVACFTETQQRRQRGRHSPLESRLCVKIGEPGARHR